MTAAIVNLIYLLAAVLFIVGLKGLGHPRSAVRGNLLGALGMLLAIVATLVAQDILNPVLIVAGLAVGGVIGAVFSANILTSMMDKLIAGFIAISVLPYVIAALPPSARGIEFIPSTMHLTFPKVFTPLRGTAVTYP